MASNDRIQLAHGGGGQLTVELIERVILPAIGSTPPGGLTDSAVLSLEASKIAFTTDSYVVQPLEFPGSDIGKLAVCGTVNDLAVAGAVPKVISLALVIAEGFEIDRLRRILSSLGETARLTGVAVVTGDTKVVGRNACDGLMINTAGIGSMHPAAELGFQRIQEGDQIVLSGPLGEHGMAVMSQREGLSFSADLESDCAPIHELTAAMLDALGSAVKFMRDPTRGGLAATLVEIATSAGRDMEIDEKSIPINRTARGVAEMLGLDLLSAANEGKLVAVVASGAGKRAVEILTAFDIARSAAVIGQVGPAADNALVELVTSVGGRRVLQMPYGEQLPRIC